MGIIKRNRGNSKGAVAWQDEKTSSFNALAGNGYSVDTTSGTVTATLPSSAVKGDTITFNDYAGTAASNNIILDPNGLKIESSINLKLIRSNRQSVTLVYLNATRGWIVSSSNLEGELGLVGIPGAPTIGTAILVGSTESSITFTAPTDTGGSPITEYTVTSSPGSITNTLAEDGSTRTITISGLSVGTTYTFTITATNSIGTSAASAASNSITTPSPSFISATGGTVTEAGDFRVHSFTGDGCFVVSVAGNPVGPLGGPSGVDYLVLAGGGGGGGPIGGGGGAGGYRESYSVPISGSYTASPLATPTGITVSATTYPITVGGGGSGNTGTCTVSSGVNSTFSTITSAGGGYGPGQSGGSGAGGGHQGPGGTGNTPPVSPPQGNNGGSNSPGPVTSGQFAAGGGGGAGGSGNPSSSNGYQSLAGSGGTGTASSINASAVTRAGGGGGGGYANPGDPGGAGGPGGGGKGTGWNGPTGSAATTNTGGGGGGGSGGPASPNGFNGGSGLVIIRYKYQ